MALETMHGDFDELPPDVAAIGVMGVEGDVKHVWDPKDPEKVAEAKKLFDTLTAAGYRAYRLKRCRNIPGEEMSVFDSKAKKMVFQFDENERHILLAPPFRGG